MACCHFIDEIVTSKKTKWWATGNEREWLKAKCAQWRSRTISRRSLLLREVGTDRIRVMTSVGINLEPSSRSRCCVRDLQSGILRLGTDVCGRFVVRSRVGTSGTPTVTAKYSHETSRAGFHLSDVIVLNIRVGGIHLTKAGEQQRWNCFIHNSNMNGNGKSNAEHFFCEMQLPRAVVVQDIFSNVHVKSITDRTHA